jgi:hypothetical protein
LDVREEEEEEEEEEEDEEERPRLEPTEEDDMLICGSGFDFWGWPGWGTNGGE